MVKRPSPSTTVRPPPPASSVRPEDLDLAKRDALLQLKIGRSAHFSAVLVSTALAVDAILLLFLLPTLPTLAGSDRGWVAFAHSFYLIPPIVGGLILATVGLASKWGSFQLWPWEAHFATSVGGFAVMVLAVVLYALRIATYGPTGHLALYPALVPLVLAGTSVALLGVVTTWRPWGIRQWICAVTAVAPVATAVLIFVPSATPKGPSEALAVSLLLSAILYQTSGSFLHLGSSGTAAHEEAVVLYGQSRIVRLAGEVQQRDEAIRFREAALVKREADTESTEAALLRHRETQRERESRIEQLEAGCRNLADTLAQRERDIAGREAALEVKAKGVDERAKEVGRRGQELGRQVPELATREQRLAKQEGDLARREVELQHRAHDLDRRQSTVAEGENRMTARRKEIDQKTAELLRREGEVAARERTQAPGTGASRPALTAQDLAARETRAQHLKTLLDEQNVQLGRRAKDVSEQAKAAETKLRQIAERQASLASREAALAQREGDLEERLKAADERRLQFETALRDYQQRLDEVGLQQISAAQKGADLDRNLRSNAERERALEEREAKLRTASADLDRREGMIVLRERSVDADEAEVSLRRQAIARETDLPFAGLLAVAAADHAEADVGAPSYRSARGRRGPPAAAPTPEPDAALDSGTLAAPVARKHPERLPTGTPRLDDLLLGGLPPRSHVVLVGDAFSGKEIALYAFIAEGLKRGEPALLVTAARSCAEISESLGVVLPQFREYEQMRSVTWIDASGSGTPAGPNVLVAKGSDDRAGILTSLVQAAKQAEETARGGTFRVGFFGLSAILAHADERLSFSFLQNVVGILKPRNALAMYALEAGALSEAQVESLLGRMDGAIVFRQDRDRTYLSVKGFGDVATREWVEARATSRSLIVGSFALERIR
jgi:KaiC/GvpD/RAD55 family RecA-like ATPase